jgi:hypothetical protein
MTRFRLRLLLIALVIATGPAGCGGKAYLYEPVDTEALKARAETRVEEPIRVSAAVPGRAETTSMFGIDLYGQGIQPVWLEIENSSKTLARYSPVSTDPEYFSALEVAYKNRRGYSDEAREAMNALFNERVMPRYIQPGETRSGFVFTHADSGAKGFNVDVFGGGESRNFTFLLRVPGFEPDYAKLNLKSMYADDDVVDHDFDTLEEAVRNLPCCSANGRGEASGEPLNLVLIGSGEEILRALLRSDWRETSIDEAKRQTPQYLFGREQDAIFRYETIGGDSFYELRFWKAPFRANGKDVYAGQARHFYRWIGSVQRLDADVDNARNFAIQKFLYGQAITKTAWLAGREVVPVTSFWDSLITPPYFSDGYRMVMWLSAEPVSILDIDTMNWDGPPRWLER